MARWILFPDKFTSRPGKPGCHRLATVDGNPVAEFAFRDDAELCVKAVACHDELRAALKDLAGEALAETAPSAKSAIRADTLKRALDALERSR